MQKDIEILKTENAAVHAETLALQWLLASFMTSLVRGGSVPRSVVEEAFDCSEDVLTELAMIFGDKAHPEHTLGALRIVEQLRQQVFAAC